MAELFQGLVYLGGFFTVFVLLLLPVLFLLAVSLLYIIAEAVYKFQERRGMF